MTWTRNTPNRPPPHQWQKTRTHTLNRHNHTCQLQYTGCTHKATEVDHIVNLKKGGDNSPNNLQAVCEQCHKHKTRNEAQQARNRHKRTPKPHPTDTLE